MGDIQRAGCSLPFIDLTSDNASRSNQAAPYIDLTGSDNDRGSDPSPEIVDLADDNNQHLTSDEPLTALTDDNDRFLNYRIPVIDLTNDDFQDIIHQTQCTNLTHNAKSSNHAIQNFNIGGIDGEFTNRSTKLIDLTADESQDFNPIIPAVNLTSDKANDRLQSVDLIDIKQQNINDCIQTIDLTDHSYKSIDGIIPVSDLKNDKDSNNERTDIDQMQRNEMIIEKPFNDVEMCDLICNSSPISFEKDIIENNLRIKTANHIYNVTENDPLKSNETSRMNEMLVGPFSSKQKLHNRKENLENPPIINCFESTPTISSNNPLRDNFEYRIETILTNGPPINNFEGGKETIAMNQSITNSSEEKYLSLGKSEKISKNNTSDFLKPAHRPILLRHSLGRSTVNTSQNIPIECLEVSEDVYSTLTVSSIIRRKKTKLITDTSGRNPPASKNLSTSRQNTFFFGTFFEEFFRKWEFWIFLLLTFIGIYYWI